ncbi:MAG: lipase [Planctomycetota bacterium]
MRTDPVVTRASLIVILFFLCAGVIRVNAQDETQKAAQEDANSSIGLPNIAFPTMGGKQFWTDCAWRQGWCIQQNVLTKHFRLLDDRNIRRAWGSRSSCNNFLDKHGPENRIEAKTVFVLMHGLFRSSASMRPLAKALEEKFDCEIVEFGYASSRASISDHSKAFREFVDSFPENTKFSCVGHSMGNIVLRHAIGDWQKAGEKEKLSRLEKVVMLGPPNQGAAIARQLAKTGVFKLVSGQGGMELGPEWEELKKRLATPTCKFGIIAGRVEKIPNNPLVGEGDFVVSVEETKLEGAADFLEVPQMHTFLMESQDVQQAVVSFIQNAKF